MNTHEILTPAILDSLPPRLRPIQSGKYTRAGCPFHGSDKQRSLSIDNETGRFQCFVCEVWGYTEEAASEWRARHQHQKPPRKWERRTGADRLKADTDPPQPLADEWQQRLARWQADLDKAAEYLEGRRIPLEIARELRAGLGRWAGAPRLILPHTDDQGRIVSLYGRRIDGKDDHRHHHLDGPKGWLASQPPDGEVWICEGAFDAMALMAAGIRNTVAIFGLHGIRWNWLQNVNRIVFALDGDESGKRAIADNAKQAQMRGIECLYVTSDELGGAKDVAEAWQRGTLALAGVSSPTSQPTPFSNLPEQPPAGIDAVDWMDYRRAVRSFEPLREQALAAGFTDLYEVGPNAWTGGAIWLLRDAESFEITDAGIVGTLPSGKRLTARSTP